MFQSGEEVEKAKLPPPGGIYARFGFHRDFPLSASSCCPAPRGSPPGAGSPRRRFPSSPWKKQGKKTLFWVPARCEEQLEAKEQRGMGGEESKPCLPIKGARCPYKRVPDAPTEPKLHQILHPEKSLLIWDFRRRRAERRRRRGPSPNLIQAFWS